MSFKKICASLVLILCLSTSFSFNTKAFANVNDVYSMQSIKERIVREAINQGMEPAVVLSLVKQESGFNKDAKSYVGAVGLFQLMPETAANMGYNPYYLDQNIEAGIKYLRSMKDEFGSTKLALAAYNAGPGAIHRYGGIPPYRETQNYVRNIMSNYHQYQKFPDPALISRPDRQKVEVAVNTAETNVISNTPFTFFSKLIEFFT